MLYLWILNLMSRLCASLWSSLVNRSMEDRPPDQADHPPSNDSLRSGDGLPVETQQNQAHPLTREEFAYGMESQREKLTNIVEGNLQHFSASLVAELERVNKELLQTGMGYQWSLVKLQEENAHLLQMHNTNVKKLQEYKKKLEQQQKEINKLISENEILRREKENLQSQLNARSGCQRQECINAKRRVTELQRDLEQLSKVSAMKQFEQQHESKHDKLGSEYEALWTNVKTILEDLERHFEDRFYAKVFLSHIFMEGYERSKIHLSKLIKSYFDELYKVHVEEEWKGELENRSRIYGLLLHSSKARTKDMEKTEVNHICDEIKGILPPPSKFRARETLRAEDLPLEKVVKVAWKFVTQPCPIIVNLPARFNTTLQDTNAKHWDDKHNDSFSLTYARPVVYRSYHGILLSRGLVGNI